MRIFCIHMLIFFMMLFLVFVLCSHAAANVPFLLVYFKNFLDGRVHLRAYYGKLFGYVFMYGCRKLETFRQCLSPRKDLEKCQYVRPCRPQYD